MMDPHTRSLDEQLEALSPDIEPPKTVWYGVVAQIAPQRAAAPALSGVWAMAASVACAVLAGALVWAVLHGRPSGASRSPVIARTASFDEPSDARYTAVRAGLETTFRERLALLDPQTRAKIESSLAVIRQAHADIRKALASEPANPVLERLFESTWHDEIDLYDQVVRATQPALART